MSFLFPIAIPKPFLLLCLPKISAVLKCLPSANMTCNLFLFSLSSYLVIHPILKISACFSIFISTTDPVVILNNFNFHVNDPINILASSFFAISSNLTISSSTLSKPFPWSYPRLYHYHQLHHFKNTDLKPHTLCFLPLVFSALT